MKSNLIIFASCISLILAPIKAVAESCQVKFFKEGYKWNFVKNSGALQDFQVSFNNQPYQSCVEKRKVDYTSGRSVVGVSSFYSQQKNKKLLYDNGRHIYRDGKFYIGSSTDPSNEGFDGMIYINPNTTEFYNKNEVKSEISWINCGDKNYVGNLILYNNMVSEYHYAPDLNKIYDKEWNAFELRWMGRSTLGNCQQVSGNKYKQTITSLENYKILFSPFYNVQAKITTVVLIEKVSPSF